MGDSGLTEVERLVQVWEADQRNCGDGLGSVVGELKRDALLRALDFCLSGEQEKLENAVKVR